MFKLAEQFSFEQDTEACWLAASCGYGADISWQLHLQSKSAMTHLSSGPVLASLAIYTRPPLGATSWRDLPGRQMEIPSDVLHCGFQFRRDMFAEWEDLLDLHLEFGAINNKHIEVFAEGHGAAEAAADIFPSGEISFRIQTLAVFRGVGVNVPLNATDPLEYSTVRVKALLPHYSFVPAVLRKTSDEDGTLRAVEVLFGPEEAE